MIRAFLTITLFVFCHNAYSWYILPSEMDAAVASYEEEIKKDLQIFQKEIEEMAVLANEGDLDEQYRIGLKYRFLSGRLKKEIPDYLQKSAIWFRKAAKSGHIGAQLGIAEFYRDSRPSSSNMNESEKWYFKVLDQNPDMSTLGFVYEGLTILYVHNQLFDEAETWLAILTNMEEISAHPNMASTLLYFWQECLKVECGLSNPWRPLDSLHKLADSNANAKYYLGLLYKEGIFVPQNYSKAVELFTDTLDIGANVISETGTFKELSLLYEQGFGVKADMVVAHALLRKICRRFSQSERVGDCKRFNALAAIMTHAEIQASEALFKKWRRGNFSRILNAYLSEKREIH